MPPIRAKKHRLPDAAYRGRKNVAFTANEERRRPVFRDASVVESMLPLLVEQTAKHECLVGVYCFMPDPSTSSSAASQTAPTPSGQWTSSSTSPASGSRNIAPSTTGRATTTTTLSAQATTGAGR